jgi:hypothetical protein
MRSNRNCFYTLVLCSLTFGILGWHYADSLKLSWSGSCQNEAGFEIERRSADTEVFSFIAIVPSHKTWYSDHNLGLQYDLLL